MKLPENISRDRFGVAHLQAKTKEELFYLFGYAHAYDRGLQMLFTRIIGQGRLCEYVKDSPQFLKVDSFFRRMNWDSQGDEHALIKPETRILADAYVRGINDVFDRRIPWELRMLPYKHEPWILHDSLISTRMAGYVGLSQVQTNIERLFIEMVQAGLDDNRLHELFPPELLEGCDRNLLEKVVLEERIVPDQELWDISPPQFTASNSWVIHGSRTASGKPILANDPHLDTSRLPAIWYELVFELDDYCAIGATMPGLPGLLVGRTPSLSWGATYSYMDTVDSWIEQCRDGKFYREGEGWVPFEQREEVIKRRKNDDATITFYENMHGVLEGDPNTEGYYLSTRWSGSAAGPVAMNSMVDLLDAQTVEEGMDLLGQIETTWSWVLSDAEGSIGFQMSGLLPKRGEGISGFIPALGWKKEQDWKGYAHHHDLPRCINPESGYFVTANNDLNAYGIGKAIGISMGEYRADRIKDLIQGTKTHRPENSFTIQFDLYSLQAEKYMKVLKPLLPDTPQGKVLKDWDCRYSLDSKGAWLFEQFYASLIHRVFGDHGLGGKAEEYIRKHTGTLVCYFGRFDEILLKNTSSWFGGKSRDELFRETADVILGISPRRLKKSRKFRMKHILFGDTIFKLLRLNRGPHYCRGSRATIHQGQLTNGSTGTSALGPSLRMVTDFSEPGCSTALAGGPSDRFLSRWYASDVKRWITGSYKRLDHLS